MVGWLRNTAGLAVAHVAELGLLRATDTEIFARAREASAIVVTKDADFVRLLDRDGPPPQGVWITAGNLTNARLRELVHTHWERVLELLTRGEALVEIGGR